VDESRLANVIGARLKELRRYRTTGVRRPTKLIQADVAEEADIPRQTLSAIENGHQAPSIVVLYRLCRALQAQIYDVLPPVRDAEWSAWTDAVKERRRSARFEVADQDVEIPEAGLAESLREVYEEVSDEKVGG
jgi:DNA-binding XRE family transcriptional regulator